MNNLKNCHGYHWQRGIISLSYFFLSMKMLERQVKFFILLLHWKNIVWSCKWQDAALKIEKTAAQFFTIILQKSKHENWFLAFSRKQSWSMTTEQESSTDEVWNIRKLQEELALGLFCQTIKFYFHQEQIAPGSVSLNLCSLPLS